MVMAWCFFLDTEDIGALQANLPRDTGDWVRVSSYVPSPQHTDPKGGRPRPVMGLSSLWERVLGPMEKREPGHFEIVLGLVAKQLKGIIEFCILWDTTRGRVVRPSESSDGGLNLEMFYQSSQFYLARNVKSTLSPFSDHTRRMHMLPDDFWKEGSEHDRAHNRKGRIGSVYVRMAHWQATAFMSRGELSIEALGGRSPEWEMNYVTATPFHACFVSTRHAH